jgi:hypothetical protein
VLGAASDRASVPPVIFFGMAPLTSQSTWPAIGRWMRIERVDDHAAGRVRQATHSISVQVIGRRNGSDARRPSCDMDIRLSLSEGAAGQGERATRLSDRRLTSGSHARVAVVPRQNNRAGNPAREISSLH